MAENNSATLPDLGIELLGPKFARVKVTSIKGEEKVLEITSPSIRRIARAIHFAQGPVSLIKPLLTAEIVEQMQREDSVRAFVDFFLLAPEGMLENVAEVLAELVGIDPAWFLDECDAEGLGKIVSALARVTNAKDLAPFFEGLKALYAANA